MLSMFIYKTQILDKNHHLEPQKKTSCSSIVPKQINIPDV